MIVVGDQGQPLHPVPPGGRRPGGARATPPYQVGLLLVAGRCCCSPWRSGRTAGWQPQHSSSRQGLTAIVSASVKSIAGCSLPPYEDTTRPTSFSRRASIIGVGLRALAMATSWGHGRPDRSMPNLDRERAGPARPARPDYQRLCMLRACGRSQAFSHARTHDPRRLRARPAHHQHHSPGFTPPLEPDGRPDS